MNLLLMLHWSAYIVRQKPWPQAMPISVRRSSAIPHERPTQYDRTQQIKMIIWILKPEFSEEDIASFFLVPPVRQARH
jgi:hypothetical protein